MMAQYPPYQPPSQYPQQQQQYGQQASQYQQYGQQPDQYQQFPAQGAQQYGQYLQPYQEQASFPQQSFEQYGQQAPFPQQQYASPQPVFATARPAPVAVMQLATTRQLGELRATYVPRISDPRILIGMIIGLLILDAALIFFLFTRLHLVNPVLHRIAFIIAVLPIVGIIYAIVGLMHCKHRAYLFTYGLVYARGEKLDALRWEEVSAIWHRSLRQSSGELIQRYEIQRHNGAPLKLGTMMGSVFVHAAELGALVEHEVVQAMLPNALAAYSAGQILPFGKLSVSLQGIAHGKRVIPWN